MDFESEREERIYKMLWYLGKTCLLWVVDQLRSRASLYTVSCQLSFAASVCKAGSSTHCCLLQNALGTLCHSPRVFWIGSYCSLCIHMYAH